MLFRKESDAIPNYHLSIKIFSRGKGASAVAKAAYRAAEIIKSEYTGATHDYTRKSGVIHTKILLPEYAPSEYKDRSILWNAVEMSERNSNAQLAREIEISLPVELSQEQNISLAYEYVQKNFVDKGMCADICVHDKNDGNPHAHIMLTMRPLNKDGTWAAKSRKEYIFDDNGEKITLPSGAYKTRKISTVDWNDIAKAEDWRKSWADIQNQHLEKYGFDVRVDHRSYERQGIDKIPTIHMGVAASQMERKGILTDKGNHNRQVEITNREMHQTKARIRKVKTWLYSQPIINPPSFIDVMKHIADAKNLDSRWKKIPNLQTQAQVLIFLQNNSITDMEHLVSKVTQINEDLKSTTDKISKVDRRLEMLAVHLTHAENHRKHKAIYKKYQSLAPKTDPTALNSINPFTKNKAVKEHDTATKKQEAYYAKHAEEIQLYKNAKAHFDAVMNGRKDLPISKWQAEQKTLSAERLSLAEKYYRLKDEVKSVEVLRRGVDSIMREEVQRTQPKQEHSITL